MSPSRRIHRFLSLSLILTTAATASAEGVVLEAYTGPRPASADKLMAPILEELGGKGYRGGQFVGSQFENLVSRASKVNQGLSLDFEQQIDKGHTAWTQGKFTEAVKFLTPMIEMAKDNPGAFVDNERGSAAVLKGLIALALSQDGIGDTSAARKTIGEILRTFPNEKMSAGTYGTTANKLFESVRAELAGRGRGRLVIKPANAGGVVYLNERIDGVGNRTKDQLLPGEYRVMLQTGAQISRSHTIKLTANEDATLTIDGDFDHAVRTRADWTGFGFDTAGEREKYEAHYAAAFGKAINASAVAVIGIDVQKGRPSVIAALINRDTGGEIRRASIPLEASPSRDQLRGLARFLVGEEAGPGIEIQVAKDPVIDVRTPETGVKVGAGEPTGPGPTVPTGPTGPTEPDTRRWGKAKWVVGALAVGGLGAAGILSLTNGWCKGTSPTGVPCRNVYDNSQAAWITLGSAAAVSIVAVIMFATDKVSASPSGSTAFVVPTSDGAIAGYALRF